MRYIAQGIYIIDTTTDIAIAKAIPLKGKNDIHQQQLDLSATMLAKAMADALNSKNYRAAA